MNWLGLSYITNDNMELSDEDYDAWKEKYCPQGEHLFDEMETFGSENKHELICDACQMTIDITYLLEYLHANGYALVELEDK